jgi:RimJ/RimL family protein N-acetyltransferase
MGNEKVMFPIPLNTYSRAESDAHLLGIIKNEKVEIRAITIKKTGVFIGFCAVTRDNEILYRLRPQFWGNGYGKEAVLMFVELCFATLKLEYLIAEANATNTASMKILERFMSRTGEYFDKELNCEKITFKLVAK